MVSKKIAEQLGIHDNSVGMTKEEEAVVSGKIYDDFTKREIIAWDSKDDKEFMQAFTNMRVEKFVKANGEESFRFDFTHTDPDIVKEYLMLRQRNQFSDALSKNGLDKEKCDISFINLGNLGITSIVYPKDSAINEDDDLRERSTTFSGLTTVLKAFNIADGSLTEYDKRNLYFWMRLAEFGAAKAIGKKSVAASWYLERDKGVTALMTYPDVVKAECIKRLNSLKPETDQLLDISVDMSAEVASEVYNESEEKAVSFAKKCYRQEKEPDAFEFGEAFKVYSYMCAISAGVLMETNPESVNSYYNLSSGEIQSDSPIASIAILALTDKYITPLIESIEAEVPWYGKLAPSFAVKCMYRLLRHVFDLGRQKKREKDVYDTSDFRDFNQYVEYRRICALKTLAVTGAIDPAEVPECNCPTCEDRRAKNLPILPMKQRIERIMLTGGNAPHDSLPDVLVTSSGENVSLETKAKVKEIILQSITDNRGDIALVMGDIKAKLAALGVSVGSAVSITNSNSQKSKKKKKKNK